MKTELKYALLIWIMLVGSAILSILHVSDLSYSYSVERHIVWFITIFSVLIKLGVGVIVTLMIWEN